MHGPGTGDPKAGALDLVGADRHRATAARRLQAQPEPRPQPNMPDAATAPACRRWTCPMTVDVDADRRCRPSRRTAESAPLPAAIGAPSSAPGDRSLVVASWSGRGRACGLGPGGGRGPGRSGRRRRAPASTAARRGRCRSSSCSCAYSHSAPRRSDRAPGHARQSHRHDFFGNRDDRRRLDRGHRSSRQPTSCEQSARHRGLLGAESVRPRSAGQPPRARRLLPPRPRDRSRLASSRTRTG